MKKRRTLMAHEYRREMPPSLLSIRRRLSETGMGPMLHQQQLQTSTLMFHKTCASPQRERPAARTRQPSISA